MESKTDGQMRNTGHDYPDAEELAAFLDGTLSAGARRRIEEHAADCDACRTVLGDVVEFGGESPTTRPTRDSHGRRVLAVAAMLLAAATLVLILRSTLAPPDRHFDPPHWRAVTIAMAGEPTRPAEGRLSGFSYSPPPVLTRGRPARQPSADLRIAAAALEKETALDRRSAAQEKLGLALLAVGDLDRAVDTLKAAVAGTGDADVYSDLAAAYLTRAIATDRDADLPLALDAAVSARRARPDSQAALFNEALVLETMGRHGEAVAARDEYLVMDPSSRWAGELRDRIRQ